MILGRIKSAWRSGWISAGILTTSFMYLLKLSWLKWGDFIIDTGREMYLPAALSQGAILYRDIFYLYGPFSPYYHAFLFKIFGVHLHCLIISSSVFAAIMVFFVYKISRMFLNVFFSTLTALTVLYVCAFGHYLFLANYNFIIPYSYPAVHALVFSLAALFFFFRFLDKGQPQALWLSGLSIFLCLITRIEMGIMLLCVLVIASLLLKGRGIFKRKSIIILFGLPLALTIIVYGFFWLIAGDVLQKSNLASFASTNTFMDNPFTSWLSGLNKRNENLLMMAKSLFFYGCFGAWFALGGFLVFIVSRRIKSDFEKKGFYLLIAGTFFALSYFFLKKYFSYGLPYRSFPIILGVAMVVSIYRFLKFKVLLDLKVLVLSVFSFFVILRILLNVHPGHYGFSLMIPGMIVCFIVFFFYCPQMIQQKHVRTAFVLGFTALFIMVGYKYFLISSFTYHKKDFKLSTPRGSMMTFRSLKDISCAKLIQYLASQTKPWETVAVLPEGLTINFLSQRENPLYYYSYMPPDFYKEGVEQDVIDDIEAKQIDYIVLLQRSLGEYNVKVFGQEYAQDLWQYVLKNYILHAQIGSFPYTSPQFGIAIFKRKK